MSCSVMQVQQLYKPAAPHFGNFNGLHASRYAWCTPMSRPRSPRPQVKRAEDDLLAARRANTALRADKAKLDETISTLQLENDMVARQVGVQVSTVQGGAG